MEARADRRGFLKIAGTAAAGLAVSAGPWVRRASAQEAIRLGDIEPLTGPFAGMGKSQAQGVRMAVEELNKRGGVLGRKVELVVEDDETKVGTGVQKATKLIQKDKVHFLTGIVSSAVALAVADIAQREKVVFMGLLSSADDLTGARCHRYYFRVTPSVTMYARASGLWMAENLGKTWHFVTADYAWGHSGLKAMREVIESKGGKILANEMAPLGTTDFSSQLLKVKGSKPDILGIIEVGNDAINLLKQVLEFGVDKQMKVGGLQMMYEDAMAVSPHFVGYWGCEWLHTIDTPGSKEFVRTYRERFKETPTTHSWEGYIGVTQLFAAVERAKSLKGADVIRALEGHKFDALKTAPAYWREWDHQLVSDVLIIKAKEPAKQARTDPADLFELIATVPGERVAPTRQENPCKLEPLA